MIYLKEFSFPSLDSEERFLDDIKQTCYDTYYPFRVISYKELETVTFQLSLFSMEEMAREKLQCLTLLQKQSVPNGIRYTTVLTFLKII